MTARERTFRVGELRILTQGEQSYARTLAEDQLHLSGFGITHENLADERNLRTAKSELAGARLPIGRGVGELMVRGRRTAR